MPKLKTKKAAAKRFKKTKSGRLKRTKAFGNHMLTKKSSKRKRGSKQKVITFRAEEKTVIKMLPSL